MNQGSHDLLAELLLAWEDAFQAGHDLFAADLARDHPEIIAQLDRRICILKKTYWIDHPPSLPDADCALPAALGRLLGNRYRLDERIAVGGFAEVWRALDIELQRTVAVKIPKAGRIAVNDTFLAEARWLARLRHPSITPVHDVGIDNHVCYIVSEYMDGGSLADRLARGPIDNASALRWVGQIANALDFAHREGVIHRDVKPANILLNHHGDAMLADFGIAESMTTIAASAPSIGTLRYMAPEQLLGASVGPTADIYSLGIILHEALTGATPHSSNAPVSICSEVTGHQGLSVASSMPHSLTKVCRRAICRDPAHRYQIAADFAADLRKCATEPGSGVLDRRSAAILTAFVIATAVGISLRTRPWATATNNAQVSPTPVVPAVKPAPHLGADGGGQTASLTFLRIEESLPWVIQSSDVGLYREWQDPPDTYFGTLRNDVVCSVVYRFDSTAPVRRVRLIADSRCWDFTKRLGGAGRGAAAIDVSRNGIDWTTIRDAIEGPEWAGHWFIDEPLPAEVLGGRSLWVRCRLLTNGSPNTVYSVAQFGRNRTDPSEPTFGIVAELAPLE